MNATVRPAVFLDRDGTLIEDMNYVDHPDRVKLIPGVPEALNELKSLGNLLVVISNQSGVARGYTSLPMVLAVNARVEELLLEAGGPALNAFYFCPHFAEGAVAEYSIECACRKPRPGLVLTAAAELGIDLTRSAIVGNNIEADVALGLSLGLVTVYFNKVGIGDAPDGIAGATADFTEVPAIIKRAMALRGGGPARL